MRTFLRHRLRAQSIIETVVGIIFLIPIVLLLFDVGVLILANTANDNLAKQAARAAASATSPLINANPLPAQTAIDSDFQAKAKAAAQAVVSRYAHNTNMKGMFMQVKIAQMDYYGPKQPSAASVIGGGLTPTDPGPGNVQVYTNFKVQVPVPFPGFGPKDFVARAVEPIVAQPP